MVASGEDILDMVGLGFGPANLALAVALEEEFPGRRVKFLESRSQFGWHPGMMLDGAGVQNSYLKDLVTLRNPRSRFSFLAYLKEHGRLHKFLNLAQPNASRWEFNDYFRWVAGHFGPVVDYGWRVVGLAPDTGPDGVVRTLTVTAQAPDGGRRTLVARNVVLGMGGRPQMLPDVVGDSSLVIHSSQFLERFGQLCPDRSAPVAVAVVGAGQSGAELAQYVAREYPHSTVDWIVSGAAPRPADDTPYVNDIFMEDEVDRHYQAVREQGRPGYHDDLRNSNYGVADSDLLHALYRLEYDGVVRGRRQLTIHTRSRLIGAVEENGRLSLKTSGGVTDLRADCLVLATGYDRGLPPGFADGLLPLLLPGDDGRPVADRDYRLAARPELRAGVFVQSMAEDSHGLGDTLFPVMPFRAARIAGQIAESSRRTPAGAYPPARHREDEPEILRATMRQYPLAVVTCEHEGRLHASSIPLILDVTAGENGTLFGHFDANNPQTAGLDGKEILAVFQGPNTYISPHVYRSDPLPTWNFVSVHVRGTARVIGRDELVAGLVSIPENADHRPRAYRLAPDDPRIAPLIGGIVGFRMEIREIEGRFKLSQDRNPVDRALAQEELCQSAADDQAGFIAWLHEQSTGAPE